ncbi:unnamed protein product [Clavelina lepadiformis]|uniref:Uncharacterized protein n=1 Tax=Clavelina lepadiformis TaxID=159417 RepID=A0ABP0GIL7_CLALP
MDDEESPIPQHFPWRSGREANTRGIWVWNKPYLIERSDGRKMGVILLDTEGSFSKTGKKNDNNIFAFSTLLSCVQIYNMKDELNEQKLESLAIFTSYAEEAGNKDDSGHIFQTLMLLVRDWNDDRYKCGIEGGTKYMKDELNDYDGDDEDMIAVREKIFQAFKQVKCTLLPQPGPIIAGFGTPDRKDTKTLLIKDISPTMRIDLRRFFHHLLDKCTEAKHIGGRMVKGEEILNYSIKLFDLLQNDQILNATSAMRGIDVAKAQTLIQQLQQDYDDNMKKVNESYCSEPELIEEHEKNLNEAHRKYDDGFSTVYDDHKNKYRTQLTEGIDILFHRHNQKRITEENDIRSKYEKRMESSLEEYRKLLKSNSSVAETSTIFSFLNNDLKTDAFYDEYVNTLKGKMEEANNQWESLQLLSKGQKSALEIYKTDMENKIKKELPTMATLENLHKKYAKKSKKLLMSKYTTENTSQSDKEKQKNELNEKLAEEYKTFKDRVELDNCKKELSNLENELRKSKEQNKKQLVDLTSNKDVIRQLTEKTRQLEDLENKKNSASCQQCKDATHIPLEQIWAIQGEEGFLGKGGFGCVRLGFTTANGAVAIKIFEVTGSRREIKETHNKVMKEIRNLKLSNHANVIRLEGYTTWRGAAGIIMEYMPAGDLHFFLTACNNHTTGFKIPDIPADIRLRICVDVASGVAFLHHGFTDQRITHGDLKPHNILLTYDLRCKVGDFGGAQFATCTDEVQGIPVGGRQEFTYCYASPQRLLNRTIRTSKAMDVYSVSMIYYEVLARKAPFRGSGLSRDDIVEHVARQRMRPSLNDVESLKEQSSTDDKEIISLIEDQMKKCWSHSPEERPSMIDVRDVFERVLATKDIPSMMRHVANITQHMDISIPSRRQVQCVRIDEIPTRR